LTGPIRRLLSERPRLLGQQYRESTEVVDDVVMLKYWTEDTADPHAPPRKTLWLYRQPPTPTGAMPAKTLTYDNVWVVFYARIWPEPVTRALKPTYSPDLDHFSCDVSAGLMEMRFRFPVKVELRGHVGPDGKFYDADARIVTEVM